MKGTMMQFPPTLAPLLERAGKLFPNLPWIVQCLAYLSLCRQVARWHREAPSAGAREIVILNPRNQVRAKRS